MVGGGRSRVGAPVRGSVGGGGGGARGGVSVRTQVVQELVDELNRSCNCGGGGAGGVSGNMCTRALRSLAALARSAPHDLVPAWPQLLALDAPVPRLLSGARMSDVRAAAADAFAALVPGAARLVTVAVPHGRAANTAYTPTAYMARGTLAALCGVLARVVLAEHGSALGSVMGATVALLRVVKVPGVELNLVTELLCAVSTKVHKVLKGHRQDAQVRAKALTAVAAGIAACNDLLDREVAKDMAETVVNVVIDTGVVQAPPLEEALLALQALCETHPMIVRNHWDELEPILGMLVKSHRDVLALHAVRVVENLLAATMDICKGKSEQVGFVYRQVAVGGFKHAFHAVRAEAALCAEVVLRACNSDGDVDAFDATDAVEADAIERLLHTAVHDDAISVRGVAVRALGYTPVLGALTLQVCTTLQRLFQTTRSVMLQSRCAWALASIVQRVHESGAGQLLSTWVSRCLELVSSELVAAVSGTESGISSTTKNNDKDTRATGLVRLTRALLHFEVSQEAVDVLCLVVRSGLGAKTRWNACTSLGAALESAGAVDVLYTACGDTSAPVKVRSAAARAVRPAAEGGRLGVLPCAALHDSALRLRISGAPRDAISGLVGATAALVHDALALPLPLPTDEAGLDGRVLFDAIAVHANLPGYVMNPRAELPSGSSLDATSEALGGVTSDTRAALRNALMLSRGDVGLQDLCVHIERALDAT